MTLFQKEQVRRMRCEGKSYSIIAGCLGISENTIKSFSQRNNLGGMNANSKAEQEDIGKEVNNFCKNCCRLIEHRPSKKPRKFCSDECRIAWWNSHMDLVSQKSIYHLECMRCGKPFDSYGNKNRKYCTHACYIKDRFMKQAQLEARDQG